jgi:carbon-monoxide dehydrogenase catalytic subunit
MHELTQEAGIETVFERYKSQQPQCTYGQQGVCCQLCSHGPCRITAKASKGICGATADTIVARNLLRLAIHGAAAYSHHLEQVCDTLIAAAEGKTMFGIADPGKLRQVAKAVGLDDNLPVDVLAKSLAEALLGELRKSSDEPLLLVEVFAPESRKKIWRDLGIIPGGIQSEIVEALTKSMTNITSDPVDLSLTALKLAIATGYMGLVGTITMQDILLGTPKITKSQTDLGILDAETVNIVAHGHIPLVGTAVLEILRDEEIQQKARDAGAKGIKLYGSMCTGQELLQRSNGTADGFSGQLGNWIAQEFMVATGAVDLVMMDMNCSIPGLKEVADKFHTKLVSVNKIMRMAGVENIDFTPEKASEQANTLIDMAIEAYKNRKQEKINIPADSVEAMGGFSLESITDALGGTLEPLVNAIASGSIKGIVAVVGCTNNKNGHDFTAIKLTQELIKRNILVVNSGCVSSGVQSAGLMLPEAARFAGDGLRGICESLGIPPALNFGSCVDIGRIGVVVTTIAQALNVDPSQLPVAVSAPEYLEQKAVADGLFGVAFGLLVHLGPVPPVTGSPFITELLTSGVEQLVGGKVAVELDPVKAADLLEKHINAKRAALNLPVLVNA